MQNVISYAIFGNNELYYRGIDTIVMAHEALYKGFELRIYHDSSLTKLPLYSRLQKAQSIGKVKLCHFEEDKALTRSMLWRMLPLWDESVDWCICRDIDSLPMLRDVLAISKAIKSGANFHFIYDDPRHNPAQIPIFGGAMSYQRQSFQEIFKFKDFEEFMRYSDHDDKWFETYAHDEHYLCDKIWPKIKHLSFQHVTRGQKPSTGIFASESQIVRTSDILLTIENPMMLTWSDTFTTNILAKGWDYNAAKYFYKSFGNKELAKIMYE